MDLDPVIEWRRLRSVGMTGGTEDDDEGTVEFAAHCWHAARSQYRRHHSVSRAPAGSWRRKVPKAITAVDVD